MDLITFLMGVSWISVALFVVGIILIIAEMFQPGFGLFGTFGVISFIACIFVAAGNITEGIILALFITAILLVMFFVFLFLFSKGKVPSKLFLNEVESKDSGYSATEDYTSLKGKKGVVTTICRPVGSADFNGRKLEVVTLGEFIEAGLSVEVIEVEGNRVVIREAKS